MFAGFNCIRKAAARLVLLFGALWLAACDPSALGGGSGPSVSGQHVQVALLVPAGSEDATDAFLAQNLENAARMAMADLNGVTVDLRVYQTGANPAQAATVATRAVNEGAQIILGPLYAEAANAAGVAVASRGVNVLAFSNNPGIAGGNVFILGPTFKNTADRLVRYSMGQGTERFMIVHGDDLQGTVGRDAIAVGGAGGRRADCRGAKLPAVAAGHIRQLPPDRRHHAGIGCRCGVPDRQASMRTCRSSPPPCPKRASTPGHPLSSA